MSECDRAGQDEKTECVWLLDGPGRARATPTLLPPRPDLQGSASRLRDEIRSSEEGWAGVGERMLC